MLRAIFFDFDGVLADSEPIHFLMLQRVLGEIGIFLSKEEYYASYLGYDDRGCFEAALAAHNQPRSEAVVADLASRKAGIFLDHLKENPVIYPGARELVREASARFRLAITSGALRHEIEFVLEQVGLRKEFEHITSAEDVTHGKPHPEGYLHALASLNRNTPDIPNPITPSECLVIEDSIPGINAGLAAGMKVLGVGHTQRMEDLEQAHAVIPSLSEVNLTALEHQLWASG